MSDSTQVVRALLLQIAQGDETARVVLADYVADKIDAAIAGFVAKLQTAANERHGQSRRPTPRVVADPIRRGQRFTRVVTEDEDGRRVVCFVERATGLIWKAATFRAPKLNFPRGQVFDLPDRISPHSVAAGGALPATIGGRAAIGLRGDK